MGIVADALHAFTHQLVNRADTSCHQQADGRYRRIYGLVDDHLIQRHLDGEVTIALDAVGQDGHTKWLCFDSDASDGLDQLLQVWITWDGFGLFARLEASRRGGHLWVCCSTPQPAAALRRLAHLACERTRVTCEIYPNADKPITVAQPVRVPFGVHQVTGERYPFLDASLRPLHDPQDVTAGVFWWLGQPLNTTSMIQGALVAAMAQSVPVASSTAKPGKGPIEPGPRTEPDPSRYGPIGWARGQSLVWLIQVTHPDVSLRQAGRGLLGWCPFHDDTAPQADGKPGTPSLYVYCDPTHGWRWKCFSPNCGAWQGKVKDQFDWLVWCCAGSQQGALDLADQLSEREDP